MVRLAVAAFLIAHGLVHLAIYATPKDPSKPPPFDPSRSWALAAGHVGDIPMRSASVALGLAVAAAYAAAGAMAAIGGAAFTVTVIVAAVLAIALKVLWFTPWLGVGLALDLGIVLAVHIGWPASL